jgi:hypothetical protein
MITAPLPEIRTPLPEITTSLPEIRKTLPEIRTLLPEKTIIKIKTGGALMITEYAYSFEEQKTYYFGKRIFNGKVREVEISEDDYYKTLKNNDHPIPYNLLRPGDPGYEKKDEAKPEDYKNTTRYVLKNEKVLHVTNSCTNTVPCHHYCVYDGRKMPLSGPKLKDLLLENGINEIGHFAKY